MSPRRKNSLSAVVVDIIGRGGHQIQIEVAGKISPGSPATRHCPAESPAAEILEVGIIDDDGYSSELELTGAELAEIEELLITRAGEDRQERYECACDREADRKRDDRLTG